MLRHNVGTVRAHVVEHHNLFTLEMAMVRMRVARMRMVSMGVFEHSRLFTLEMRRVRVTIRV